MNGKEFNPHAYHVFGPKMIATRSHFEDRALETRCLTEETGGRRLRDDIPLNLGEDARVQAQLLRNKLLMFRFRNFGKKRLDATLTDRTIEPRLAQLFVPLLSVIEDAEVRGTLLDLARRYHEDLIADRGMDTEAQVLEVIRDLRIASPEGRIAIKDIASRFGMIHSEEYDRKITAKWIGGIVRRSLQIKTYKSHGVFILVPGQTALLTKLFEKYGVTDKEESAESVQGIDTKPQDIRDMGMLPKGLESWIEPMPE